MLSDKDAAIANYLGDQLSRDPELDLDDLDGVQADVGFTFDSGRGSGDSWDRYKDVGADDWPAVKDQARAVARERTELG